MKKASKYFGLFLLSGMIFMVSNLSASAQDGQRKQGCRFLDEGQQEQATAIKAKYQKDLTYFHNKMNELRAQERTLIESENPNLKKLYSNVEAKTELQNKIAKTRTKMHIELRSIMTEEQILMMGSRKGKRVMHRKGGKNICGIKHRRAHMNRGNCNNCCEHHGMKRRDGHKGNNHDCECNEGRQGKHHGNHEGMHQRGNRGNCQGNMRKRGRDCGARCDMDLTEEQQAAFKNIRLEKLRIVNPLRNKLRELQAKKHTLMTAEEINNRDINKIIDQMSDIKEEVAKANIKQKVEMRNLLTEEQKLTLNKRMHKRKVHGHRR